MIDHRRFLTLTAALAMFCGVSQANALTLTDARFDIFVYGITPSQGIPPGNLLGFGGSDSPEGADGLLQVERQIGTSSTGLPVNASGGVANYGATFYGIADSPNNFRKPIEHIGSAVEVLVYRDYVKDHENDQLNFTYTHGLLNTSMNGEFGALCPLGDAICMNAGMLGTVSVFQDGEEIWQRQDTATVFSNTALPYPFDYGVTGDLPWEPRRVGGGGWIGMELLLEEPATRPVDLSDIDVGETFTMQYRLFAYAYDRGSHLGFQRNASAFAKDPLGASGVGFQEISGAPVPLPAAAWLFGSGLAAFGAIRRRRRSSKQ
ncbi:MAG: VPLPA-CTERM sorting domain-containing protein [Nitrospira sp.]|nr:VPLPA-CTERM sorting domain-containing protein [Nitrospira sp.]